MSPFHQLSGYFKEVLSEMFRSDLVKCRFLVYGLDIYYYAKDVSMRLYDGNYEYALRALRKIDDNDRYTISDLQEMYEKDIGSNDDPNKELISSMIKEEEEFISSLVDDKESDSSLVDDKELTPSLVENREEHFFIKKEIFYKTVAACTREEAEEFQFFVYYDLIPMLDSEYQRLVLYKDERIFELTDLCKKLYNQLDNNIEACEKAIESFRS